MENFSLNHTDMTELHNEYFDVAVQTLIYEKSIELFAC